MMCFQAAIKRFGGSANMDMSGKPNLIIGQEEGTDAHIVQGRKPGRITILLLSSLKSLKNGIPVKMEYSLHMM